ncbi:acyl carrier protein, partial [Burkholderia sp. Ap-962]|uniref:acyl carrier protein n=1 Tax=Burkholderia sp. Ap-962 TaxID=2608333 RepID=UPI00141DB9C1
MRASSAALWSPSETSAAAFAGGADAAGASAIADTDGFAEIGIDSLHATVLHRQLEREFGAALPATIAFDHP